jgi:zinc protease
VKRLLLVPALLLSACVTTQGATEPASTAGPDPRVKPKVIKGGINNSLGGLRAMGPRVVAKLEGQDPILSLRAVFTSGSVDDPAGKEGLTALTAMLMREATTSLSSTELAARLFPWAAELGVQVDKERVVFTGRVHRDHAEAFLPIFFEVLREPRLDEQDLERVREKLLTRVTRGLRGEDDEDLQREALEVFLFDAPMMSAGGAGGVTGPGRVNAPRHPYRHTPWGTAAGLRAINLDDVKAHLGRAFARDRLVFGVAGGATKKPGTLQERLRLEASKLPKGGAPLVRLPAPPGILENRAWIIDKPAAGTAISIGYPIKLTRRHPDYAAMKVAEVYFGEHRHRIGRLFQSMREKRGLNYGDYAYVEHFRQAGWSKLEQLNIGRRQQYFSIWIRPVEHKNKHWALRQTVWELERFSKQGLPDAETLERLKKFLVGHWAGKTQEPMRALGYAVDDVLEGRAREQVAAAIQKLTLDDVNKAIRTHLRADRLQMVVVTQDGAAFRKALLKGEKSPLSYAAPPSDELKKEDALIEAYDLKLKPHTVRLVKPEALFEK